MSRRDLIAAAAERARAKEARLRKPGPPFKPPNEKSFKTGETRERQGTSRHHVVSFSDVSVSDSLDLKDFELL